MAKQTVLITGASSGFGESTARLLAKKGHRLILIARRKEKLDKLQEELCSKYKIDIFTASVDVTKRPEVKKFFTNLPKNFTSIDVLVNNAGLASGLDLAQDADLDDWETMIDTNIKGLVFVTHFILQIMKRTKKGLIVNIGSVAGTTPYPKGNVYGATKAFVKQFSKNLRADLIGTDIKVSNIEPGAAQTEFSIVRFKGDKEKAGKVYENTRFLHPEDIASAIEWIIEQPLRVNIDSIEIMPIDQSFAGITTYRQN